MPVVDPNALDVLVVLNQREVGETPVVPADEAKSWDDILAKPLQDTEDSAESLSEEPVPATSQPAVDFPASQPVIPATQPALDDILP
jgi:hypothetical protein